MLDCIKNGGKFGRPQVVQSEEGQAVDALLHRIDHVIGSALQGESLQSLILQFENSRALPVSQEDFSADEKIV